LATLAPPPGWTKHRDNSTSLEKTGSGLLPVTALSLIAILVHGYHPYAEDGGLYLTGVERVLHPGLYPYWSGFATAQLHFSLFARLVAVLVRFTHLSLMMVMLLLYAATLWLTLYAAWKIAIRCYASREACYGAVCFLAMLLTVPVAGTSLMLMDPYVSARSISTPCGMLAIAAVLDIGQQIKMRERISHGSVLLCIGSLAVAGIVHPLMAAYALGCVLVLAIAVVEDGRFRVAAYTGLGLICLGTACALWRFTPSQVAGYTEVARTRTYWFIDQWHWYEWLGLASPLLVLAVALRKSGEALRPIAEMAIVAGLLALLVAAMFSRSDVSNYAVAMLQPLRAWQAVYVITLLVAGAALGRSVLKRRPWIWAAIMACAGIAMACVQHETFPDSSHLELPWTAPRNGWEQAFVWIRENTAKNAVVALDANYITDPGEDAQNFRAIAERSAPPDYSKDGGIAAIAPQLTSDWFRGERRQFGLDRESDLQRISALRGTKVAWVVLAGYAVTGFRCDYTNQEAKVCLVPLEAPAPTASESHQPWLHR
jgi:hypothetical protein